MLKLRAPKPGEAAFLTNLCRRSKAVWGYDDAFMHACREELAVTAATIAADPAMVAETGGRIVGFAQISVSDGGAELEKLYVDPGHLRTGAGRRLFHWSSRAAQDAGATLLTIDADPNAAGFYRRMGAVDDGFAASGSIEGRLLPRLRLDLTA